MLTLEDLQDFKQFMLYMKGVAHAPSFISTELRKLLDDENGLIVWIDLLIDYRQQLDLWESVYEDIQQQ